MAEIQKLKNLVNISTGITTMRDGKELCRVLSARAINENGIDYSIFDDAYATTKTKPIQVNDVLVVNRGRFSVALVDNDLPKQEITTPSFVFTLRIIQTNKIIPEYLFYYLNTTKAQNKIKSLQQGGAISFISKYDFFNIKIELPPIKQQQKIAELYCKILKLKQLKNLQIKLLTNYTDNLLTGVKNDR